MLMRRLWGGWRQSLLVVKPSAVVRWPRRGRGPLWRWRSRVQPGRPAIPQEFGELIRRRFHDNRLWGAPRIQAELEHLGHHAAKSTVEHYMIRRTAPPPGTWRAF